MKNKKQIIISLIIAIIILPIISYSLRYIDVKNETEELTTLDSILHIIIMGIITAGVAALSYNIIFFYKEHKNMKNQGTGMSFFAMLTDKEKRQLYEKIENNEYPFYEKIKDENAVQKLKDMFENE